MLGERAAPRGRTEAFFVVTTVSGAYIDPPRRCASDLRIYLRGTGDARPLLRINSESCDSIMVSGFAVHLLRTLSEQVPSVFFPELPPFA